MVLRAPRSSRKAQYCFRLLLLPLLVLAFVLRFTDRLAPALVDPRLTQARSILWVTAHRTYKLQYMLYAFLTRFALNTADDESFFFAPTLSSFLSPERGVTGHLLCLSTGKIDPHFPSSSQLTSPDLPGDHEGLGSVRRTELRASCDAFGIAGDHCVSLDHP